MSGRTKGPALSPAGELREATRAAHEAARDLRQALREARELEGRLQRLAREGFEQHTENMITLATKAAETYEQRITDYCNDSLTHIQDQVRMVTGHLDNILGTTDPGGLGEVIAEEAARSVAAQLSTELDLPPGARIVTRRVPG